ncbi:hypothetical protein [Paraflavitalea speifideaquila]|uniref:hypothetical protein n=1 Tax=Paraflavitalea speifideaquila TaxID=3076558 RepID=UPI0028E4CBA0|nr:hypothetical protein [Paraflavitalea speifideiaquila]
MDIQAYIQSGVIESYMLGIANADEVAELQRLRLLYPEIATAVEQAEQWLKDTAPAVPVTRNIKDQLLITLQDEFTPPAATPAPVVSAPVPTMRPLSKYLVAASLVLLVASVAFNFFPL